MSCDKNNNDDRHKLIQNRIELPIGDHPAARVITRSSSSLKSKSRLGSSRPSNSHGASFTRPESTDDPLFLSTNDSLNNDKNRNSSDDDEETKQRRLLQNKQDRFEPVVGEIIERHRSFNAVKVRRSRKKVNKRTTDSITSQIKSAVVLQEHTNPPLFNEGDQTLCVDGNKKSFGSADCSEKVVSSFDYNESNKKGFPSLEIPLGTFVDGRRNNTSNGIRNRDESFELLKRVSRNDAKALLKNMSTEDIHTSQQYLTKTLSPEIINYLKTMKGKKSNAVICNDFTSVNDYVAKESKNGKFLDDKRSQLPNELREASSASTNQSIKVTYSIQNEETNNCTHEELHEKLRLSDLLTSIRSYEDLDRAYDTEIEKLGLFQKAEENRTEEFQLSTSGEESEFEIACKLLRSTSQRQKLWALRRICKQLFTDVYVSHRRYPIKSRVLSARDRNGSFSGDWPYPPTLIVSLRCLLDEPILSSSHRIETILLLYTYTIQSIYYLLLLRLPKNYIVDVYNGSDCTCTSYSSSSMTHQLYCMDDVHYPCGMFETKDSSNNLGNSDYRSTLSSSSTASATADAAEFLQDPIWTLVSKMNILERLVQVLHWHSEMVRDDLQVPIETISSICGILSMICIRVPCEADVITSHTTILPDIKSIYFTPSSPLNLDPKVVVMDGTPLLLLFLAIGRQSRTAIKILIEKMDIELIILQILLGDGGITSNSDRLEAMQDSGRKNDAAENELQVVCKEQYHKKLALMLWRMMLRYGYGLSMIPTMLTIGAPYITSGNEHQIDKYPTLSSFFYSCYTVVINCAYVTQLAMTAESHNTFVSDGEVNTTFVFEGQQQELNIPYLNELLTQAVLWLSSSKQQAIIQLLKLEPFDRAEDWSPSKIASLASIISFINALQKYIILNNSSLVNNGKLTPWNHSNESNHDESKSDKANFFRLQLSQEDNLQIIEVCISLVKSELLKTTFDIICQYARFLSFDDVYEIRRAALLVTKNNELEAANCALLEALVGLIVTLQKDDSIKPTSNDNLSCKLLSLVTIIKDAILTRLSNFHLDVSYDGTIDLTDGKEIEFDSPRRHWINMVHAAICSFLCENSTPYNGDDVSDKCIIQVLGLILLGRLQHGDERTAAILCSYDIIFTQPSMMHIHTGSCASPLSSMILTELCQNAQTRMQLDHSYRLRNGPGISVNGCGAFKLKNLLSTTCVPPLPENLMQLLPLGQYWLWKSLSGMIDDSSGTSENQKHLREETAGILRTALSLIFELETSSAGGFSTEYTKRLSVGGKLYHLLNLSLLPETIYSDTQLRVQAERLFDLHFAQLNDEDDIYSFVQECSVSSLKSLSAKGNHGTDAEDNDCHLTPVSQPNARDEEVMAIFESTNNYSLSRYSSHDIRAVLTFLGDICDVYLESGFQYRLCTKFVRFFLVKWFPSKIRCELFHRLRDCLHLLSLDDDQEYLSIILKNYLQGGIPSVDRSVRDSSDFLDEAASSLSKILNRNYSGQTLNANVFLVSFLAATLSRTVAISLSMGGSGLNVAKHRLLTRLDCNVWMHNTIFETVDGLLSSSGTLDDLVHVVSGAINTNKGKYKWFTDGADDRAWHHAITMLRASHTKVLTQV